MHAFQPSPLPPRRSRSTAARQRVQRHPHRALAIEVSIKLTVNLVLSGVSIAALAQLLPYRTAQETRLQEIQTAVQSANGRTQQNQAKFSHYFDPAQSKSLMQQHSNRIDPSQRPIVWQPQSSVTSTTKR